MPEREIAKAGQLSGVSTATLVRRPNALPIGEVFKAPDGWKSYAGYELPAEFCGTWSLKTEAVAAINNADRLYKGELEGAMHASI